MASKNDECVRVILRCRPFSRREIEDGRERIVELDEKNGTFRIYKPGSKTDNSEPPKEFTYDAVYDSDSQQKTIYDESARPIVNSVMQGYNGTIFAYGQTGTGKTHTMVGPDNWQEHAEELRGIIPNSFYHIFEHIETTKDKQFLVRASYLEIYQEEVRDLLAKDTKRKLELHESADSGVYVKDLTTFVVKDVAECDKVMTIGSKNKVVGATMMNDRSSRSHTIFCITIESSETENGQTHYAVGKLNLVDLAGSEKQQKTQATGERLKEGIKINISLTVLGNVIAKLVDPKSTHIPYRDSKLTRLLQDSLGGNTKTVMVANTGPADYNYEETLSTLRYAFRAKMIKNKPRINEDPKDAMLREYQEEINRLKAMLLAQNGGVAPEGGFAAAAIMGAGGAAMGMGMGGGGGGGGGIQGVAPELLDELRNKTEEEKRAILEEKNMAEAEKERIIEAMEKQTDALSKERKQREALARKLKAMQEKLVVGGVNIIDKAKEQEEILKAKEVELNEQRRREAQLKAQMKEAEEEKLIAQEHFSSLQEEVDIKSRQLKKIKLKFEQAKNEIADLQAEFQQEREQLIEAVGELTKQLKLRNLIVASFIPPEEVAKIEKRCEFDEETGEWRLNKINLAGNNMVNKRPPSASGARRPMSRSAMMSAAEGDPRYRGDNILNLELDIPISSTASYDSGMIHGLNGDLRSPFEEDGWLMQSGAAHTSQVYFSYGDESLSAANSAKAAMRPGSKGGAAMGGGNPAGRPPSARKRPDGPAGPGSGGPAGYGGGGGAAPQENFPTARGLVSRERRVV